MEVAGGGEMIDHHSTAHILVTMNTEAVNMGVARRESLNAQTESCRDTPSIHREQALYFTFIYGELTLGDEKLSFGKTAPNSAAAARIWASSSGNAYLF